MKRIESIQALRAIAAAFIFLYHTGAIGERGFFGVEIFFIISGFLACYKGDHGTYDGFLPKRLIRVVPLYWLATLLMYAMITVKPELSVMSEPGIGYLLKSLFFIPFVNGKGSDAPVLGLGWTLNYEMFFALVFWLSIRISRRHGARICAGILTALAAAGLLFAPGHFYLAYYTNPILMEFVYGMVAYEAMKRVQKNTAPLILAVQWALCAVSAAWLVLLEGPVQQRFLIAGIPALVLFLCTVTALEGKHIPKALTVPGDISYSFYLVEYFAAAGYKLFAPMLPEVGRYLLLAAVFALTCGVSWCSYQVMEKRLGRFLYSSLLRFGK